MRIANFVWRCYPWAKGAGGFKVLACRYVIDAVLHPVAHGAFVEAGITGDVIARACCGYASPALADDDGDLPLIIKLHGFGRAHQLLAMADLRQRRAIKQARILGPVRLVFAGTRRIIDADAYDTTGLCNRLQKAHMREFDLCCRACAEEAGVFHCGATQKLGEVCGPSGEPAAQIKKTVRQHYPKAFTSIMKITRQFHAAIPSRALLLRAFGL